MAGADFVFHLAANADVRFGTEHPRRDLEQNTIATFNVLEAMRANGVSRIAFSSTGSIYGEATVIPTPEDAPFPVQTSLYGASKLAGEGLISGLLRGLRLPGLDLPVRVDPRRALHPRPRVRLLQQAAADPRRLEVLGNGKQRKSYLYVAGLHRRDPDGAASLRIGGSTSSTSAPTSTARSNDSIGWICRTPRPHAGAGIHGRRARLDRRQPVHLPRHRTDPGAWLEAAAVRYASRSSAR